MSWISGALKGSPKEKECIEFHIKTIGLLRLKSSQRILQGKREEGFRLLPWFQEETPSSVLHIGILLMKVNTKEFGRFQTLPPSLLP